MKCVRKMLDAVMAEMISRSVVGRVRDTAISTAYRHGPVAELQRHPLERLLESEADPKSEVPDYSWWRMHPALSFVDSRKRGTPIDFARFDAGVANGINPTVATGPCPTA